MKKRILFFGGLFHAEASLAAEMQSSPKYDFIPVVQNLEALHKRFYANPYVNLLRIFNAVVLRKINKEIMQAEIDKHRPDFILTRMWTPFGNVDLPDSIFWKIESLVRTAKSSPLRLLYPKGHPQALLTQNKEEMPVYKKQLGIPIGWFPRGVSHNWEKIKPKEIDVVAVGTICKGSLPQKKVSFEMLVKPLCENLPKESVHVYVNYGQEFIPWAKNNFKPCFKAEEGPSTFAKSKILISPVTTRWDKGILSHKTLQGMACRTLTITQNYFGLEDIVGQSGENMVYVDSSEECLDKVKYYLKHDSEREKIAERGHRFVHSEYNYTRVFENAMKQIGVM